MRQAIYMENSYLKEFETSVKSVKDGKYIVLDRTAFYPNSGGQPFDTGFLVKDGKKFRVVFVGKFDGNISHEVDEGGLNAGDMVKGIIDWERRYKLMRSHTSAHIISGIIHQRTGALITGNQLDIEKSRIDFSLDDYDPEMLQSIIDEANQKIEKGADVEISFLAKEEAEKIEGISKLAKGLPEDIKEIRMVDIKGIDRQADGGTHVKNTREIGKIELIKCENKGKNNRRLYFRLLD